MAPGLAAVFLIPAVLEYRFVRTDQWLGTYYDYSQHFVYLFQLFNPQWGFGISLPGPNDGMSFQIGVVPVLLSLLALFAVVANPRGTRRYWLFFLVMTGVIAILMLGISLPVWRTLSFLAFAQFPWRLMAILTVSVAVVAGAVVVAPEPSEGSGGLSLPTPIVGRAGRAGQLSLSDRADAG